MTRQIRACVTAVGGGGFGEQILKALRLAPTPYFLLGTDMAAGSAGFAQVDVARVVPGARDAGYVDAMLALCAEHGIEALFTGSEPELLALSRHRDALERQGIFFPASPHAVLELCLDKCALFDKLAALGLPAPRYFRIRRPEDLPRGLYPLVLKPSQGTGGSNNVFIVQDAEEAALFCAYLLRLGEECIAQEYVGTPESEYTVGVLTDMDGGFIQSLALHRTLRPALSRRLQVPNRTARRELGETLVISSGISQGRTGAFPDICRQCAAIAQALGARGAFNLQGRVVDGQFMLFEINPRFSGTTSMRAMVGCNEPDLLARRHILGEAIPRGGAVLERTILRRLEEIIIEPHTAA